MLGLIIWPFVLWYGLFTEQFWPQAVARIVAIAGVLTILSVANVYFNPSPIWEAGEQALRLSPVAIFGNFLAKLLLTALVFGIGFAIGRWRARSSK